MDAEDYIGDFGTATGIMAMYERGLPALREFIDAGTADAALIPKIIAEMPSRAVPPVIISDGIADVPPGEDQLVARRRNCHKKPLHSFCSCACAMRPRRCPI